jgi:regulator of cell morphogenesis and NO signaling
MIAPTTVKEYFAEDHERLDTLFDSFQKMKRSDFAGAKEAFKAFKAGLQRHIVCEEDFLFPFWEEKCGVTEGGPTLVMRAEHRQIGEQLEAIHGKLAEHNLEGDEEERVLMDLLRAHNRKEEDVLYPAIDRVAVPEECTELFRKLELIAPERYAACCGVHHKTSAEPL